MPRITYADRFQTLLNGPLTDRDRTFTQSLFDFYKRKGRLTTGRVRCVKQLEERYSPEKLAAAAGRSAGMLSRLGAVAERTQGDSWADTFIKSLTDQVSVGRDLSTRQMEILTKIEQDHSKEAVTARQKWDERYASNEELMRDKAKVVAEYYIRTASFRNVACSIIEDPAYVPTEKQYRKMVENQFAQKVLDSHYSAPKYAVGSFVALRASAEHCDHVATGNKPCVVIQTNAAPVIKAARGVKRYKVLPVGSAVPMIVEERHLKVARGLK